MPEKSFFTERSRQQIAKLPSIQYASQDLVSRIQGLKEDDVLIIQKPIIPGRYRNARHFMRHGSEVQLFDPRNVADLLHEQRNPGQLREAAFNTINNPVRTAYSFYPVTGDDRMRRRISLVECLEGAWIYAYAHQTNIPPEVKPYADVQGVAREGARVVVRVPSRQQKDERYHITFNSVPIRDNDAKYLIAHSIGSDHTCGDKTWNKNLKYSWKEDPHPSHTVNFDAHEWAAYRTIIDFFYSRDKNSIPAMMSHFAQPTQHTVDYYLNLCNNVLIETSDKSGRKTVRKLSVGEKEILLWALV
ncbi:hypothetical protein HY491_03635, partial [Candidatus Woesearchaeota archaeon]|nr:hypothetical protein [Candidatus Woesearchaeota archaeon]